MVSNPTHKPQTRDERREHLFDRLRMEVITDNNPEYYFARFMQALGHDPATNPHLMDTPLRVSDMYRDLLGGGEDFTFTTFDTGVNTGVVTVTSIPFVSFCAHHFLPFTGHANIAYKPHKKMAGLSKLARITQACAAKPNVQENLTSEVLQGMIDHLQPLGVAVMITARHSCMELRGPRAVGAITTTLETSGVFDDPDGSERREFIQACHRQDQ